MAKLTLDQTVDIRTDYLSHGSIPQIMDKFKISRDKVNKVLSAEDETSRRLAEANIQIKFNKQTEAIQTFNAEALTYLRDAVQSAANSDQPHLFLDKVSAAMERMDRISRLNLNRATEIKQTNSTVTRIDVAETIKALDTPEKKQDFLRNQLVINDRHNKNIRANAGAAA